MGDPKEMIGSVLDRTSEEIVKYVVQFPGGISRSDIHHACGKRAMFSSRESTDAAIDGLISRGVLAPRKQK